MWLNIVTISRTAYFYGDRLALYSAEPQGLTRKRVEPGELATGLHQRGRGAFMLRIDIRRNGSATAFVLEGKLVGPWVAELENCWNESAAGVASQISVDLTGVSFIDSKGRDLLAQMRRQGAKLAASGCLTMAIVNAIEKDIETEAGHIDISGSDCECEPN